MRGMPGPEMELLVVGNPEAATSLVLPREELPPQNFENCLFSIFLLWVTRVFQTQGPARVRG